MKAIGAFFYLALACILTGCCTGDRGDFESVYYTFVNDTPHDIEIELIDRRKWVIMEGYYIAAGEELTFLAGAFREGETFFSQNQDLIELRIRNNDRMVVQQRDYPGTLFDESVYERRELPSDEAGYEFVFRFTSGFFEGGTTVDPR